MSYVDGNALVGALALAFGTDVSQAEGVCAHCGHEHHFAESHVYLRNPGMVMRCPNCSGVELVLVEIHHQLRITLLGLATIHFQSPAQPRS